MAKKEFVGEYKPPKLESKTMFELSVCNDYGRHPKITKAPGKITFAGEPLRSLGFDHFR